MDGSTTGAELHRLYAERLAERGFRSDTAQLAAVDALEDLRRRLASGARIAVPRWLDRLRGGATLHRGVYLWGPVGRGKTWLMDLFCESLVPGQARRRHFHRFMHDVHTGLRALASVRAPLEHIARGIAEEAQVLCFDEFAVADIGDAMILAGLLSGLVRHGVTLVATSNVHPRELYRDGLQRERFLPAIELLERHTRVLPVAGRTDYRLRQLTQAGTYLLTGSAQAQLRLAALFAELVPQQDAAAGSIEIEGRLVPVVRRGAGAVWFEFAALCAGARSADDYIEIAREFASVIVANVPVLDPTHEDEARRFIALIDELYDRNVNLIVSAAAPPGELYRGERLVREFERTASRLTEMQSTEYLAREHRP